jgi:urease accessory protein
VIAVVATPRRGAAWAPLAFLGGMALGGAAGMAGAPLPGAEALILLSVALLGLAVAASVKGASDWMLALLAVAGMAHGHAHGAEAPSAAHPVGYVAAFLVATAGLHLAGLLVGWAIRDARRTRISLGAGTVAAAAVLLAG